jgi:hypothetical protein
MNTLKDRHRRRTGRSTQAAPSRTAGSRAFYIMGSGPGQGFTADSLQSIARPICRGHCAIRREPGGRWRIPPASPGRSRAHGRWCAPSGTSPMCRSAAAGRPDPHQACRPSPLQRSPGGRSRAGAQAGGADVIAFFDQEPPAVAALTIVTCRVRQFTSAPPRWRRACP